MKEIQGSYDVRAKHLSFELPILGEAWAHGEIYYNRALERYEYIATDADGIEYLIISVVG